MWLLALQMLKLTPCDLNKRRSPPNTAFADPTSTRANALFAEGVKVDAVRNHGYALIKGLIVFIPAHRLIISNLEKFLVNGAASGLQTMIKFPW